jgi:hypothetical protein
MMKYIRAVLAITTFALLSACGGGGGSAGNTSGAALFTTAAEKITIAPKEVQTYNIGGGVAGYKATSSSGAASVSVNENVLTITGGGGGSATITVTDSRGAKVLIEATVGTGVDLFVTAPEKITLGVGVSSATFSIGGGSRVYFVTSADRQVGTVFQNGSQFYLVGVASGVTTINVTDSLGASKKIELTISSGLKLFTSAPDALIVTAGTSSPEYSISGGAEPYTVTSSNTSVAAVTANGKNYVVKGVALGAAQLVVRDSTGTNINVAVTVSSAASALLDVLPGDSTGSIGDTLNFAISGGTAPFTITNNNPSIATVVQSNSTFTAKLLNAGSTVVTIVDSQGVSKKMTISAKSDVSLIRISPSTLEVGEDNPGAIVLEIKGGVGPYRVLTSDLIKSSVAVSGSSISVGVGSQGNRCIHPVDLSNVYQRGSTYLVTITALDNFGSTATSTLSIRDNSRGAGTDGCGN